MGRIMITEYTIPKMIFAYDLLPPEESARAIRRIGESPNIIVRAKLGEGGQLAAPKCQDHGQRTYALVGSLRQDER
jgi:hypothetical protein